MYSTIHQDGRVVKALDLRSNGRIVRVGSNPTPGNIFYPYTLSLAALVNFLVILSCFFFFQHYKDYSSYL